MTACQWTDSCVSRRAWSTGGFDSKKGGEPFGAVTADAGGSQRAPTALDTKGRTLGLNLVGGGPRIVSHMHGLIGDIFLLQLVLTTMRHRVLETRGAAD